MTDAEIIKALECCTNKGAKCSDCPAFKKVDRSDCKKYFRGAIDLINRQKAEYNNLLEQFRILDCECGGLEKVDENQKAEIERLTKETMNMAATIETCQGEAIKEFAERLKEEIDIRPTHSNEQNKYVCFLIDNLVKEMASGTSVQKTANLTKEKS